MSINKNFLKKYLNSNAPTGFEYQLGGQKIWMEYVSNVSGNEAKIDNYGTAYVNYGNNFSDYKVVIEAHADEISFFVNHIDENGYIRVIRNGGSDHMIAPSMRVNIFGEKGKVNGVFGHPAIHIKDREKEIKLDNLFIDIGASSKEEVIERGVDIGTPLTFADEFMEMGDYYVGRALDNRIGGFMIAEVLRKLKESKIELPYKLYVINSVQEEVGLYGAKMIAENLKPNVAIVTDVTHDTSSPGYNPEKQGDIKCGQGGVIKIAPSIQHNLKNLVINACDEKEIKFQKLACSSYSGTDTDSFAFSNGGIPSSLIALPLKYMHTTCEMVNKKDVESVIDMIFSSLINIKENQNFRYNVNM